RRARSDATGDCRSRRAGARSPRPPPAACDESHLGDPPPACHHRAVRGRRVVPRVGSRDMTESTLYGGIVNRRITVRDLQAAKERGERWAMLTSYDMLMAALFDEIGVPALLVGDSAG